MEGWGALPALESLVWWARGADGEELIADSARRRPWVCPCPQEVAEPQESGEEKGVAAEGLCQHGL